jgi:hypothetical protein
LVGERVVDRDAGRDVGGAALVGQALLVTQDLESRFRFSPLLDEFFSGWIAATLNDAFVNGGGPFSDLCRFAKGSV